MLNITLSRAVRNDVNALVRGHPDFEAFRVASGAFDSRDMTKDILMRAIEHLGLENKVMDMVTEAAMKAKGVSVPQDLTADDIDNIFARDGMISETEMAESVLSPLRPFLSPVLLDSVATALGPIVHAACKPPVEITRTVTLDASGNVAETLVDDANRVGVSTLGKLFGLARGKHSGKPVSLWDAADAPAIDPYFVPEPGVLAKLVTAIDPALPRKPRNVWLAGPAGSGKTSLPEQVAARARRPYVRIAFQRAIEPTDLSD